MRSALADAALFLCGFALLGPKYAECVINGVCSNGKCSCNPCWTGDQCDIYINTAYPVFSQSYQELEVLATGVQQVALASAADADAVQCFRTTGTAAACRCAEIVYEIAETDAEDQLSIPNSAQPMLLFTPDSSAKSQKGSAAVTDYKVVISASNPGQTAQPQTTLVHLKVVPKLSRPVVDAYGSRSADALDGLKGRIVKRQAEDSEDSSSSSSSTQQEVLSRQKRGVAGLGIPDLMTFTLTRVTPQSANTFKVGDLLSYQLSIWIPMMTTDCLVEVYAQRAWSTMFAISNLQVQSWGNNILASPQLSTARGMYESAAHDGRFDRGYIDLGIITNTGAETTISSSSQIILTFNALVLNHPSIIDGNSYTISVGAQYSNQSQVWVAVDTVVASGNTIQKTTPTSYTSSIAPSFSLQGPSTLSVGCASVWILQMNIRDLYNNVTITAFGLNDSSSLIIDRISLESFGPFYSYYAGMDASYNFTQTSMDSAGTIQGGILDMGQIVNSGFNTYGGSAGTGNYTITAHIVARATDTSAISASSNFLGVSVAISSSLVYSTATSFSVGPTVLSNSSTSSTFNVQAVTPQVAKGAIASFLLNMTLPAGSTQYYTLEVAAPFNNSAQMNLTRIRTMSVGYNYASFQQPSIDYSSNDTINNDYAVVNFDLITNTGERSTAWANTISMEISGQIVNSNAISIGQSLTLVVGVRLGNGSFWVGQTSITIIAAPTTLNVTQAPTMTLTNIMNDQNVYPLSSVAYYVDIYIPPTSTVYTLSVNASSSVVGNVAMTKIFKMEIYQLGSGIVFSNGNQLPSTTYYNGTGEYTLDGLPVNTSAQMTFTSTTNVLAQDWPWLALPMSTIRLRVIVQARPNATTLSAGTVLSTTLSITYSSTQSWQAQDLITYNPIKLKPYFNMTRGQPQPTLTIGNWQNNASVPVMYIGSALSFDINVATPFLTITDLSLSLSVPAGLSLSICRLSVRAFGNDMGAPTEGYSTSYSKSSNQTTSAVLPLAGITNVEPYSPFIADYTTTTVFYQLVVMLRDNPAPVSANYSYNYSVTTNSGLLWSGSVSILGIPSVPTTSTDPTIYLAKANPVNSFTLGGAALFILQIYVPPGTTSRYRLEIYGPWLSTTVGKFGIWDARVVSAGNNLPCVDGAYIAWYGTKYNTSFDTVNKRVNDSVIMDLGYLSNIANTSNTNQTDPANLVTVEIVAYIPAITTTAVNDSLSLAAALYYNNSNAWAGYSNFTVIANAIPADSSGDPVLTLQQQNSTYSQPVGVLRTWCLNISLPQTMTSLKLNFNMGSANNEALMTVHYARVIYFGANLIYSMPNITYSNVSSPGGQPNQATVDFGYIFNPYSSHRDTFRPGTASDDTVTLWFDVMVADNLANTDGTVKSFFVTASYLKNGTAQNVTAAGNITVISPPTDNTTYIWNAWTDSTTSQVLPNGTVNLYLSINHTAASRRVPRNLVAHYRIPYFSQFLNITNVTGKVPDRMNWSTKGVEFQWNALYFGENISLAFKMALDPNNVLLPGLLTQAVTIPVDLTNYLPTKADQTGNTVVYFYTPILPVQFTAYIPECYTALGMQSRQILDCQITSSSSYGSTNTATQARLTVGNGWVSAPRGPPFYQSEYVQVDMGVQTKFTAIAVQPQKGNPSERVSTFAIQYSKLGLRWYDATDAYGNRKIFEANFSPTPLDSDTVTIQFGGQNFVGRFIRVIPLNNTNTGYRYYQRLRFEIYGCLATGAVAKTYVCPTATSTLKPIVQRQMLMNPNDGRLFVCMLEGVGGNVVCSYTNDFGTSWFSIDDNVCNVNYFNNRTGSLYGVSRSQDMYVRSDDVGDTWFAIEDSEYNNATVGAFVTSALTLPFSNWDTMTSAQLTAQYNFTFGSSFWTVDKSGVWYNTKLVAWWGLSTW